MNTYLGQLGQVLILHDGCSVRGQYTLRCVGQHKVQVHCGDELDDGVAQELETLVVVDHARLFFFARHLGHDLDEHVDTCARIQNTLR